MTHFCRDFARSIIILWALSFAAAAAASSDFIPYDKLAGTIWMSESYHTRTAINIHGVIERKEGKEIYIQFLSPKNGVYPVKIHWWNEQHGIDVVEYGVLVREAENTYAYTEADHPDNSGFPGIAGSGTFRLLDASTARVSQLGRLLDGSAAAFVTRLHKVSKIPVVSVPQSYPRTEAKSESKR
jgi:hypothetical protein